MKLSHSRKCHAGCRKTLRLLFGSAILTVPLLLSPLAHAQFVIKNPAVEEGELAFVGHGSYESALPSGGDPVGWGHEVEVNYGFTDFWKSTLALELKQPVHEELEPTEFKFENYLELIDYPAHAVFSAFGAVNFGLEEGVANAAKFGPLAKFGDDDLSLTLNAIFEKTFGKYRTPGTASTMPPSSNSLSSTASPPGPSSLATSRTLAMSRPSTIPNLGSGRCFICRGGAIRAMLASRVTSACSWARQMNARHDDQMGSRADLLIRKVFPFNRKHGSELPRAGSHCCDDPLLGTQIHWQNDRRLEA